VATYLSHSHGVVPGLQTGPKFDIGRYAAVGGSRWTEMRYYQWRAISPVWPVVPDEMRYYAPSEHGRALDWVKTGDSNPDEKSSNI
jgi:hypothetical protein